MRLDPVNEKRFNNSRRLKVILPTLSKSPVSVLQDIGDNDMSVARIMYYGDRLTIGVTSISGVETNEDPIRDARFVQVGCETFFAG